MNISQVEKRLAAWGNDLDGLTEAELNRLMLATNALQRKVLGKVHPMRDEHRRKRRGKGFTALGRDGKRYPTTHARSHEGYVRILDLRRDGWSMRAIAQTVGCSLGTVQKAIAQAAKAESA